MCCRLHTVYRRLSVWLTLSCYYIKNSAAIGWGSGSGDPYLSTSFPSTQLHSLLHFPAAGSESSLPECVRPRCKHTHTHTHTHTHWRMHVDREETFLGLRNSQKTAAWNTRGTRSANWKFLPLTSVFPSSQIYPEPKNDGECLHNIKEFLKGCTSFRVEVSTFFLYTVGLNPACVTACVHVSKHREAPF